MIIEKLRELSQNGSQLIFPDNTILLQTLSEYLFHKEEEKKNIDKKLLQQLISELKTNNRAIMASVLVLVNILFFFNNYFEILEHFPSIKTSEVLEIGNQYISFTKESDHLFLARVFFMLTLVKSKRLIKMDDVIFGFIAEIIEYNKERKKLHSITYETLCLLLSQLSSEYLKNKLERFKGKLQKPLEKLTLNDYMISLSLLKYHKVCYF